MTSRQIQLVVAPHFGVTRNQRLWLEDEHQEHLIDIAEGRLLDIGIPAGTASIRARCRAIGRSNLLSVEEAAQAGRVVLLDFEPQRAFWVLQLLIPAAILLGIVSFIAAAVAAGAAAILFVVTQHRAGVRLHLIEDRT